MGFLFKTGIFIAIIAITAGFVITKVPELKQKVVEYINPAAKERRILGDLDSALSDIDHAIAGASGATNDQERDESFQKARDLISQAKNLQKELEDNNDKNDGLVRSNLTKIIDSFIDDTPYPADHLEIPDKVKEAICRE